MNENAGFYFAEELQERFEKLLDISYGLRQELHGYRMLYDESDPSAARAIEEYDEFVGEEFLSRKAGE